MTVWKEFGRSLKGRPSRNDRQELWPVLLARQLPQPFERLHLPGVPHRAFVAVQAVASRREFQVFCRDVDGFQGIVKHLAVVRRDGFVIDGVREECGRRVGCDVGLIGKLLDVFRSRVRPHQIFAAVGMSRFVHRDHRIDEDRKIGAATLCFDWVKGLRLSRVEVSRSGRRQVAAGGKSHDSDL